MGRIIHFCRLIVLALILFMWTTSAGRLHRLQRSLEETDLTTAKTEEKCQENTPCGWAVYTPFTRKINNFMKNTCVCPTENNTVCLKVDDDLSVSAYVYRCRQLNSSDTNSS